MIFSIHGLHSAGWRSACLWFLCCLALAVAVRGQQVSEPQDIVNQKQYRERWLGVKAPPLTNLWDRITGPMISLEDYRGQKVLLYSFDAGNFVDAPDENKLIEDLEDLHRTWAPSVLDRQVIGFTRGVMFFGMGKMAESIQGLTNFPVVNLNNRREELALHEPYDILVQPSAIVIDRNGVIVGIFAGREMPESLQMAASLTSWDGVPREPPERSSILSSSEQQQEVVTVVAARDLAEGSVIGIVDLARDKVPIQQLPMKWVSIDDARRLLGMTLKKSLKKGQSISWDYVEPK